LQVRKLVHAAKGQRDNVIEVNLTHHQLLPAIRAPSTLQLEQPIANANTLRLLAPTLPRTFLLSVQLPPGPPVFPHVVRVRSAPRTL